MQRFQWMAGEPGSFAAARAQAKGCPQVRERVRSGWRTFPAGVLAILGLRGLSMRIKRTFSGGGSPQDFLAQWGCQ